MRVDIEISSCPYCKEPMRWVRGRLWVAPWKKPRYRTGHNCSDFLLESIKDKEWCDLLVEVVDDISKKLLRW